MNPEEFDVLVARLHEDAERHPRAYLLKVAALAALGYAALSWLILVFGGLCAAGLWAGAQGFAAGWLWAAGAGAVLYRILKRLRFGFAPIGGVAVPKDAAPELHALIDRLRAQARAPRLKEVKLVSDWNAAIITTPRFGPFLPAFTLAIGLPLMESLTADEFAAVLAHEIGHLSREHGRFGAWIYRLRAMFHSLSALEAQRRTKRRSLLKIFLDWYLPLFGAHSLVLARAQEREADQFSAALAGRDAAAAALVDTAVLGTIFRQDVGAELARRAAREPAAPLDPHAAVMETLAALRASPLSALRRQELLHLPTHNGDTHPCLADRLSALGVAAGAPIPAARPNEPRAFDRLIPAERRAALKLQFHELISPSFARAWTAWRAHAEKARLRVDALAAAARTRALEDAECRENAAALALLGRKPEAIDVLRGLLERKPDDGRARLQLGSLLIHEGDASGVSHLERAADLDAKLVIPSCALACGYLERAGDLASAERFRRRLQTRARQVELARAERARIDAGDAFLPHGLAAPALAAVVQRVSRSDIKNAYVVRRAVQHLPEEPCYLLAVERSSAAFRPAAPGEARRLVQQLAQPGLPAGFLIVTLDGRLAPLQDSLEDVPGALVRGPGRSSWTSRLSRAFGWAARAVGIAVLAAAAYACTVQLLSPHIRDRESIRFLIFADVMCGLGISLIALGKTGSTALRHVIRATVLVLTAAALYMAASGG